MIKSLGIYLPPSLSRARRYIGTQGVPFEAPSRMKMGRLYVLQGLVGLPWDEHALKLMPALRPSYIRVTHGEETTDSILWRVTVRIDEQGIIREISQEVETEA